jgi:hypothetical protein
MENLMRADSPPEETDEVIALEPGPAALAAEAPVALDVETRDPAALDIAELEPEPSAAVIDAEVAEIAELDPPSERPRSGATVAGSTRLVTWAAAGVMILLAGLAARDTWRAARTFSAAHDALPLYLSGATLSAGGDPTDPRALEQTSLDQGLNLKPAVFSNLYPASAGALVRPLTRGSWAQFLPVWRAILPGGALAAGAGAGLAAARGRQGDGDRDGTGAGLAAARGHRTALAASIGAWIAVGPFPVTAECLGLGQVNLLIGGLLGSIMAALALEQAWLAGLLVAIGASIKLVPAMALVPIAAARRWAGVVAAVAAGALVRGMTLELVSLERVVWGVRHTLDFQSHVQPDRIGRNPAAPWLVRLGELRHLPLAGATLVLAGGAAILARRRAAVVAGGVALAAAWLGTDAAAFHILYAPLHLPALVYAAVWALDDAAPRGAWLTTGVAAIPSALYALPYPAVPEARLVIAGYLVWVALAVRLVWGTGAPPRRALGLVGLALAGGLIGFALSPTVHHLPPGARPAIPAPPPGG